jgi:hypothetical protein
MYTLYTDKIEKFSAKIKLEGASLKKSQARLVVESEDFDLMFKGTISSDGEVEIPVKRLKGLLEDRSSGNIRLEVIAEDTYFIPWESTFEVETSKKVTVEVKSQGNRKILENKTEVEILSQKPTITEKQHVLNLVRLLIKEDITVDNLVIKRNKLNNIIATYIKENTIEVSQKPPVINKVLKVLEKRK